MAKVGSGVAVAVANTGSNIGSGVAVDTTVGLACRGGNVGSGVAVGMASTGVNVGSGIAVVVASMGGTVVSTVLSVGPVSSSPHAAKKVMTRRSAENNSAARKGVGILYPILYEVGWLSVDSYQSCHTVASRH